MPKTTQKCPKQPKSSQKTKKPKIPDFVQKLAKMPKLVEKSLDNPVSKKCHPGNMTMDDPTVNSGQKLLKSARNRQKVAKRQKKVKNTRFWPKLSEKY